MLHSRDVTERKRRERRVAAQHEAARILAESPTLRDAVPRILTAICESLEWDLGAVWTLDPARRCLRCDALWRAPAVSVPEFEALCRRTTFSPGMELPGRVWSGGTPAWIADVGHDSTSPRASVAAREGLRGALGFPIHTHDGVVGVMEFFSRRIGQPDDELLQILGVISCQLGLFIARQEMAEAVRESEARARLVVETAPNAVITIDAAGIVTGWNGAAERLFGWSRDMVVGQSLGTTVIAPQNRAEYERGLARLLAIGEGPGLETLIEITALRRDGHGIPVELVVWPVCARGAHAVGVLVRDITERKRAERLRAGHEQAIELLRARDEALAASRAKVEFLADRTHDIRTLTTLMEPRGGPAEAESQMELDLRRGVESGGVPALLAHVWVSIGGREGAALAHAAHALERSCWAMGAGAIGALRWGIEHLGQASVLAAARETLARAEEELRHVRAVLDARRRPARPRDP